MDCDLPTVYSDQVLTARIKHFCCECSGVIKPCEKYNKFSGCWDGKWQTYKTCKDCMDLRHEICNELDDECWPAFQDLYQEIFGARNEVPEHVFRYMDIRRKRNSPRSVKGWMEEAEIELKNEQRNNNRDISRCV